MQNHRLIVILLAWPGCVQAPATTNAMVSAERMQQASAPVRPQRGLVDAPPQSDVEAALGTTPPEACTGPAIDLAEAEHRCRCVLPNEPSGQMPRAGLTCGEALTSRDLSPWISLSLVPGKLEVEAGKELSIALQLTNRARVAIPLVYRLHHALMLHDKPYWILDGKGENASTGGTCAFAASASSVPSLVVLEPGGTATLRVRVPASREIFARHGAPEPWGCHGVGVEPLAPGPYSLEVFLEVPGLVPEPPRLMFEVLPAAR